MRDHESSRCLRLPRSGGPGGVIVGSLGRGGGVGSGFSLGRGSRFGPRGRAGGRASLSLDARANEERSKGRF
jgi:hypothetical protein